MKTILKILFIIFLLWMITGAYLLNTEHPKAQVVIGLGVLYMSFILMPLFIYYRYKDGKYKKYIINSDKDKKKAKD
ncbi:hypothetical protein MHM83_03320 [Tenacibaculum sp. Mcav3-52]|uniref:Uncharacterized protein n=2 Tax=Tenacibaculum TaxID=104267 RepID=A0AAE9MNK7_9FLAO|nr:MULTISPECIES: hypothetical protein [Tenacibaculum]GFD75457.1 hypothetical protein KUL113_48770 [Tenacibaculum sp. KUL113]GFD91541.1 hypothetical protein KUL154_02740 [Alteromonas sp. KUL154]GFE00206.1 hypothetical protein KUL156_27980 [Alteromonas sp. KUL156]AZJ32908.1 hypothetical protein D6200_10225 [Tenacibaculum mesophilum]KAF9659095.1 hypothetical protein HBA12_02295 [Tenacibaculum mesophilum]